MTGRPYSRIKGSEPSVTTIIGEMTGKPGLSWGASKETALFAVHHQDQWIDLDPVDAVDRLRRHFQGIWDGRASMGTVAHAVNEAWCHGQTVDLSEMVAEMSETERSAKTWRGHEADIVSQLDGYVAGLEKFWHDWQPESIATEYVVRTPGVYIGTTDWLAEIGGRRLLLDIKSTAERDVTKGIYHESWALQLAAYRFAAETVTYGENDKGKPVELSSEPNHASDGAAVIHLRGDGEYVLYDVAADDNAYIAFIHMAEARKWVKALAAPRPLVREAVAA